MSKRKQTPALPSSSAQHTVATTPSSTPARHTRSRSKQLDAQNLSEDMSHHVMETRLRTRARSATPEPSQVTTATTQRSPPSGKGTAANKKAASPIPPTRTGRSTRSTATPPPANSAAIIATARTRKTRQPQQQQQQEAQKPAAVAGWATPPRPGSEAARIELARIVDDGAGVAEVRAELSDLVRRAPALKGLTTLRSLRGLANAGAHQHSASDTAGIGERRRMVDVVAAVAAGPPTGGPTRAKGGPREYCASVLLTDHVASPGLVVEASLYRRARDALPVTRAGDVILLRDVAVVALKGKGFGLRSTESSAWAVFEQRRGGSDDNDDADEVAALPQIRGPPVEVDPAEAEYALLLQEWFARLGDEARGKMDKAIRKVMEADM